MKNLEAKHFCYDEDIGSKFHCKDILFPLPCNQAPHHKFYLLINPSKMMRKDELDSMRNNIPSSSINATGTRSTRPIDAKFGI